MHLGPSSVRMLAVAVIAGLLLLGLLQVHIQFSVKHALGQRPFQIP
jgi:hypothetical protein